MKRCMLGTILFVHFCLLPFPVSAEESEYLGPETVVDITPEEALADPNIIRINTAGGMSTVQICIHHLRMAIARL